MGSIKSIGLGIVATVAVVALVGACGSPYEERPADADTAPRVAGVHVDCEGNALPSCSPTSTGPTCTLPCETGAACDYALYCHSSGELYGMNVFGGYLYTGNPAAGTSSIEAAFENWIVGHEGDLGLDPGLVRADLGLTPHPHFRSQDRSLTLFRFVQRYRGIEVLGPDNLVQLTYTPFGAIGFSGAIIDSRVTYANLGSYASLSHAEASILQQASQQTGLATGQLRAEQLRLVALPSRHAIGYAADVAPKVGTAFARVVVDADGNSGATILPLWDYHAYEVEGLGDEVPISVRTIDPDADPALPLDLSIETTLSDGSSLLGSIDDVSGDPQLATERVVVFDLNGGSKNDLNAVGTRITDPSGSFVASADEALLAQAAYQLMQSWYAAANRYMISNGTSRWDSAIAGYTDAVQTQTLPGTFEPSRGFLGYTNVDSLGCPGGGIACATWGAWRLAEVPALPEAAHLPPGTTQEELTGTMIFPQGLDAGPVILSHEFGHVVDLFLGPGITNDAAPTCGSNCQLECVEDTSDEAPPLGETIAQMLGMWFAHETFSEADFEYCAIIDLFNRDGSGAFDPGGCMPPAEQISHLLRDADCPAEGYCDKPEAPDFFIDCCDPATEPGCTEPNTACKSGFGELVGKGYCQASGGYDVFSAMQSWWQLLNGFRCDPDPPFACETAAWPQGVLPVDVAVPAFLYSLRLRPLSYAALFDGMALYVGCNFGADVDPTQPDVYSEFNAILCNHEARDCDAPAPSPAMCSTCGNGVREGGETCDGTDWAVPECAALPEFVGGTLQCDASCQLDTSMCIPPGLDSGSESSGGPPMGTGSDGSSSGSGGGQSDGGGGSGCDCSSGSSRGGPGLFFGLVLLGLARTRRGRSHVLGAVVGVAACGPGGGGELHETSGAETNSSTSGSTGMSGSPTSESSSTGPSFDDVAPWLGTFHNDAAFAPLDQEINTFTGSIANLVIRADRTATQLWWRCNQPEAEVFDFEWEVESSTAIRLFPLEGGNAGWFAVRDFPSVLLELGPSCNELTSDVEDFEDGSAVNWLRGEACWVKTCEAPEYLFHATLCEGEGPIECP